MNDLYISKFYDFIVSKENFEFVLDIKENFSLIEEQLIKDYLTVFSENLHPFTENKIFRFDGSFPKFEDGNVIEISEKQWKYLKVILWLNFNKDIGCGIWCNKERFKPLSLEKVTISMQNDLADLSNINQLRIPDWFLIENTLLELKSNLKRIIPELRLALIEENVAQFKSFYNDVRPFIEKWEGILEKL